MPLINFEGNPCVGKTTALGGFPPKETYILSTDGKRYLASPEFSESKKNVKKLPKETSLEDIGKIVWSISQSPNAKHVKYVIIDSFTVATSNFVISNQKNDKNAQKKWADYGQTVWEIFDLFNEVREDLYVIIITHPEVYTDNGVQKRKFKTHGTMTTKHNLSSRLEFTFTLALEEGNKRVLYCAPTDIYEARCPRIYGFPPTIEADDFKLDFYRDVVSVIEKFDKENA